MPPDARLLHLVLRHIAAEASAMLVYLKASNVRLALATRRTKDRQLTPAALVGRWETEATDAATTPRGGPPNC